MIKPDNVNSDEVHAAFFTRRGGVSTGLYNSLNCGYGSKDDTQNVTKNRTTAAQQLIEQNQTRPLLGVHQIHSSTVVTVTTPYERQNAPKADALVTKTPNLILSILTADCVPILFSDQANAVIGAAHAGWRGATSGIIENTITAMLELGAQKDTISIAIGPAISGSNYEVGQDVIDAVHMSMPEKAHTLFTPNPERTGYAFFDIKTYCACRAEHAGIKNISISPHCTYAEKEQFFSYRRATHLKEADYGRQISMIAIETAND